MTDNVLLDIKRQLEVEDDDPNFDEQIIDGINDAFAELWQISHIGPLGGFQVVTGDETWTEFSTSATSRSLARKFVYLTVKLDFDPPSTSFVLTALQERLKEVTWRLNAQKDWGNNFE